MPHTHTTPETAPNGTMTCSICGATVTHNYSRDERFVFCYDCKHTQWVKPYHHYKRNGRVKFFGRGSKKYFGIELEMYPQREYRTTWEGIHYCQGKVAKAFAKEGYNGMAMLESDSSVQVEGGFELVLQPCTLRYLNWNGIIRRLENLPVHSFRHYSTGLHVHVSRNAVSEDALGKVLLFMMDPANENFLLRLGQRTPNGYCKKNKKNEFESHKSYIDRMSYPSHSNRYYFVNMTNRNTIEFRFFKGNINPEAVFRAVHFVDSITEYAETHVASEMTFQKYTEWLMEGNKTVGGKYYLNWSLLTKWLRRKWETGVMVETPRTSGSYLPPSAW